MRTLARDRVSGYAGIEAYKPTGAAVAADAADNDDDDDDLLE